MAETTLTGPAGFSCHTGFISETEEDEILRDVSALGFSEVRMHGVVAKREVLHFGWIYGYQTWTLLPGPPIPEFLHPLRDRVASLAGIEPASIEEVLLTHYPPGSGIGWHCDAPMFGPVVIGVSLLGSCRLKFCRRTNSQRDTWSATLEPRSVYVLSGAARFQWQHSIPATKESRYSITFRTLRNGSRQAVTVTDRR
jgi:alkylated DNA repair protein (DNA oxidative demethylase)